MGKRKTQNLSRRKTNWENYLALPATSAAFEAVLQADFQLLSPRIQALFGKATEILQKKIENVDELLRELRDSMVYRRPKEPSGAALRKFEASWKLFEGLDTSHWEKRAKIHELGLNNEPYRFSHLLQLPLESRPFKIQFIQRKRMAGIKGRQVMSEHNSGHHDGYIVNASTGHHVVDPGTSVIFFDIDSDGQYLIELVVICGVGMSALFSESLFKWLLAVVGDACHERHDIRPNHGGLMTQIGMNLGPRHSRAIGWASSFTLKLDAATKAIHDSDVIGAVSLTWSLLRAVMPVEIISEVDKQLRSFKLPRLATRNVKEGSGFHLNFNEKTYLFPTAERAPPEAYLSQGYEAWTHVDPAYCKWAFSFCIDRTVTAYIPQVPSSGVKTRSSQQKQLLYKSPKLHRSGGSRVKTQLSRQKQQTPKRPEVHQSGGSFVDASLKVVVRQARGTMIAFQPSYMHGTSIVNGAYNSIISINFSSRVADAWQKIGESGRAFVTSASGAGDGNTWAMR